MAELKFVPPLVFALLFACLLIDAHQHDRGFHHPLQKIKPQSASIDIQPSVTMNVQPTLLQQSGDWVTLQISGVPSPSNDDWIGVYSPSNVNFNLTSPVKYKYCNISSDYNKTGAASLLFRLVNMHEDYIFALYRGDVAGQHNLLQVSNTVSFANPNEPLQGHLALTENTGEMSLMWGSGNAQNGQSVKWGSESGQYSNSAQSTGYSYSSDDLCGSPAVDFGWKEPGWLQTAIMSGLNPNTQYFYVYGSDSDGWSQEQSFYSAPVVESDTLVNLIAYGDMGKAELDGSYEHWEELPSINTTRNVLSQIDEIDLVLHIGDIAYAVGYSAQWDEFLDQISPVAMRVPYMTLPGNHERDYPNSGAYYNGTDSGGECGIPYENRFHMPYVTHKSQWYSFNYGNIHFIMISTELDFRQGSAQQEWLQQDLASVNKQVTPWIILSGHRPMYIDSTNNSTVSGDQTVATLLRESLEDLLVKYGVDLALWGHHHSYQRSCHVWKEKCYDESTHYPVHVVIGMAGMGLSQNLQTPEPEWIEVVDDTEYGYSRITTTATRLHFQYFSNTRGLRDDFVLKKD